MNIETKLKQSLSHRKSSVILRSDVANIGSQTQVTSALKKLIVNGELQRISRGVYIKSNATINFDRIVKEIAIKLNIEISTLDYNQLFLNNDTVIIEVKAPRVKRDLEFKGKRILFRNSIKKAQEPLPLSIPKNNVQKFVKDLAKQHKISYQMTPLDIFGSAVTRLAGDNVVQDDIRNLIIALKRAGKISARQLISLSTNYLHEKQQNV
jgi:hypothetical protein